MEKFLWQTIESNSTFPPFRSIMLEEEHKQSRALPLVLSKEESLNTSDQRIQTMSEQVNWTNIALRGMPQHTFVTNEYARKKHIESLHKSLNNLIDSTNALTMRVSESKIDIGLTIDLLKHEAPLHEHRHKDMLLGLDYGLADIGRQLATIEGKTEKI